MHTTVIRIGEPIDVQGTRCYPLGLYVDDGTERDWAARPTASANMPVEAPAHGGHPPMDVAAVRDALRSGQCPPDRLMAVGADLYRLVAAGDMGPALAAVIAAQAAGGHQRVVFDVRPPELRSLPWELMIAEDGTHLFLDERTLCVRASFPPAPAEDVLVPCRVLVVVGDPHDAHLRAEDEVDAIQAALRRRPGEWHVVVLRGPARDALLDFLREFRPHVFHFIGHTGTDPMTQEPVLEFRPTPGGQVLPLSAYKIRHLPRVAVPRLVFLNACRSAEILRPDELASHHEAAWSVAGAFEKLGSAAVLSMQADIPSGPAVRFTGEVYRQLADGEPIDAAVRRGREVLFQADAAAPRDWALPCLTLRTLPQRVLPVRLGVSREAAERLIIEQRYRDVQSLVDRTAEHWDLWGGVESDGPPLPAALVTGAPKVGKSALVRSCLLTWQLRGCPAAYADLRADKRQTWLDAVRLVRDALTDCLPERAREPRRMFDHQLGYLCAGEDPQPLPAAGGRTDPGGRWDPRTEREPELRAAVFGALRDMLRAVAGDRPLTLAVDHLSAVMDLDVEQELLPRLFMPIGTGNLDPVRIVLVETTESAARLIPDDLARVATVVKALPFERDQRMLMYREYFARTRRSFTGEWSRSSTRSGLSPSRCGIPASWPPSRRCWRLPKGCGHEHGGGTARRPARLGPEPRRGRPLGPAGRNQGRAQAVRGGVGVRRRPVRTAAAGTGRAGA